MIRRARRETRERGRRTRGRHRLRLRLRLRCVLRLGPLPVAAFPILLLFPVALPLGITRGRLVRRCRFGRRGRGRGHLVHPAATRECHQFLHVSLERRQLVHGELGRHHRLIRRLRQQWNQRVFRHLREVPRVCCHLTDAPAVLLEHREGLPDPGQVRDPELSEPFPVLDEVVEALALHPGGTRGGHERRVAGLGRGGGLLLLGLGRLLQLGEQHLVRLRGDVLDERRFSQARLALRGWKLRVPRLHVLVVLFHRVRYRRRGFRRVLPLGVELKRGEVVLDLVAFQNSSKDRLDEGLLLDLRHRRGGVGRLPLDGSLGRRLLRRWVNVHGLGLRLHLRLHLDLHLRLHLDLHLRLHLGLRLGFRLGRRLVDHRRGGDRLLVVFLLHSLGHHLDDLLDQVALLRSHLGRVLLRVLAPAREPALHLPRGLARLLQDLRGVRGLLGGHHDACELCHISFAKTLESILPGRHDPVIRGTVRLRVTPDP